MMFTGSTDEWGGSAVSTVHFPSGWLRQVSCYTLLSRCQPPWPPSCCLEPSTSLRGSYSQGLQSLDSHFGTSRIASPAYQEVAHLKLPEHCPIDSLTIVQKCKYPHELSSCLDWTVLLCASAILRETSETTSYKIVRWVSRLYTQIRRTICTSVPRRSSTWVSSGLQPACE